MAVVNTYWRTQQKTTHAQEALARYISQFRDLAGFTAITNAFTAQIQILENTLWELYQTFDYRTATGIYLDRLGQLLGQPRNGLSDEDYRIWIAARLRVSNSTGTMNELLDILHTLDPDAVLDFSEYPPATYSIIINASTLTPAVVADIVEQAQPAGVQGMLMSTETEFFLFGPGALVTTDDDHGLGDSTDASVGGYLADLVVF